MSEFRPNFNINKLKYTRLSQRVTAEEAGSWIGISANAYYKKERGQSNITANELNILLHNLRVPLEQYGEFFSKYPSINGDMTNWVDGQGYID